MLPQKLQPVAIQERIQTIDIIRGFALFGILIINFTVDAGMTEPWAGFTGFIDQLVYWPIAFFMNDKFVAIYCFLFGLGFSIQMLRAKENNSPFVFVYLRRLIVLYIIGAIHQILTRGDIVGDYAMAGVLLLILHWLPRKLLPVLAVLCFLVPWTRQLINGMNQKTMSNQRTINVDPNLLDKYVGVYKIENGNIHVITRKADSLLGDGPARHYELIPKTENVFKRADMNATYTFLKDSTGKVNEVLMEGPATAHGRRIDMNVEEMLKKQQQQQKAVVNNRPQETRSYKKFVIGNAQAFWNKLKNWSWKNYFWGFSIKGILPLFLMGLYFGRRKVFYNIAENRLFLKNVMKWGLIIGMTSFAIALGFDAWNYFNGIKDESYSLLTRHFLYAAWDFLGVMGMALGYVAGMALLLDKADWKKRLSFLGPIGRMGLTNYLIQAIIISVTIDSYGFNLNGKAGPAWRLLMALVTFAFIIFLSRWWFKRFRIGPAEWLWRSLTYLKFQPMRLKSSDKAEEKEKEKN